MQEDTLVSLTGLTMHLTSPLTTTSIQMIVSATTVMTAGEAVPLSLTPLSLSLQEWTTSISLMMEFMKLLKLQEWTKQKTQRPSSMNTGFQYRMIKLTVNRMLYTIGHSRTHLHLLSLLPKLMLSLKQLWMRGMVLAATITMHCGLECWWSWCIPYWPTSDYGSAASKCNIWEGSTSHNY